jgi:hypothetical protein
MDTPPFLAESSTFPGAKEPLFQRENPRRVGHPIHADL